MRNGKRWGGDTECFYFKAKNLILKEIKNYNDQILNNKINYDYELSIYKPPKFGIEKITREKNLTNLPKTIVCLTDKNKIFESIAETARYYKFSAGSFSNALRKNKLFKNI